MRAVTSAVYGSVVSFYYQLRVVCFEYARPSREEL